MKTYSQDEKSNRGHEHMIYNNLKNIKVVTQKVSQLFYDTIEANSPIGNILNIIISESGDKNYPIAISYIVEK